MWLFVFGIMVAFVLAILLGFCFQYEDDPLTGQVFRWIVWRPHARMLVALIGLPFVFVSFLRIVAPCQIGIDRDPRTNAVAELRAGVHLVPPWHDFARAEDPQPAPQVASLPEDPGAAASSSAEAPMEIPEYFDMVFDLLRPFLPLVMFGAFTSVLVSSIRRTYI